MSMSLWEARGQCREICPRPESLVTNLINRRIRNVIDTRTWSDLIRMGMIVIPQQYNTGTVSLTSGSNQVIGSGTAWPVNNAVNTVLAAPIVDSPGFVEIQPASLAGITQGSYLLLDQETPASTEVVSVQGIKSNKFIAYCQYPHSNSRSIQKSNLAGQQINTGAYVYTVQAVTSPTQLQIDMQYGGVAQTAIAYFICVIYCKPMAAGSTIPSSTARRMIYAFDAIAGETVGTDKTSDWLAFQDPQMQQTGNPEELISMAPDPGGAMQWTLWPLQTGPYGIGVVYQDGWPTLRQPNDILPPFINPEVFIAGAVADCMRATVIANDRQKDPFHDPQGAMYWEKNYDTLLEAATQSDEGRRLHSLQDYRLQMGQFAPTWNWYVSHASYGPSAW
jgi:hypothetical protein